MRLDLECIFLLIWALIVQDSSEEGYCSFPGFLWAAMPDGSDRKWLSKTEYVKNTNTWERQREITVRKTEMIIRHKVRTVCNNKFSRPNVPCFRKDIIYHVICLAEEPGDKFRVVQKSEDSEEALFTCLKFVKVNDNILQVFSAVPKELNEDRLCYENSLQREEWPWIVPEQISWSRCPFEGGYDFIQYYGNKKQVCVDVWRPARMEMECIYGEGVDFIFPDKLCNTLADTLEFKLQCWGSWDEEDFKFIVLSHGNSSAQYVMRFPQAINMYSEYTAFLYFSPVCPLTTLGQPPGKVHYVELRMTHSEPGVCFDESEKCRAFAQEGKCTNSALHEYANFCRRSCGLCELMPPPRPECRFPVEYRGEWMQFENDRKESVTIASGEITFSNLGHFICKTKHWAINRYKLMSVFVNGCRPRYTCIHFSEDSDVILQYQICKLQRRVQEGVQRASSKHIDESFQMCSFQDDPPPLGNKIRSKDMKILLPTSHIHWGSCGLNGEIRVNVSLSQGSDCQGILTDWNPRSCNSRSKLILALQGQSPACLPSIRQDHVCIAHMNVDDDYSLLITQHQGLDNEFRCWGIQTYPETMYYRPWKKAVLMTGAKCGTEMQLMSPPTMPYDLILQIFSDKVEQPCRENDHIMDIYDLESTSTISSRPTSPATPASSAGPDIVRIKTEVVSVHEAKVVKSIKPRERKSNMASVTLPCLLTHTAALCMIGYFQR